MKKPKFIFALLVALLIAALTMGCLGENTPAPTITPRPTIKPTPSPTPIPSAAPTPVPTPVKFQLSQYSYAPLVRAICDAAVLHYDAFLAKPDMITTNLTMYFMITREDTYKKSIEPNESGAYTIPEKKGSNSAKSLYENIFTDGEYINISDDIMGGIINKQNSDIVFSPNELPKSEIEIYKAFRDGENMKLFVKIMKQVGTGKEKIGEAQLELTANKKAVCGYTIASFVPYYEFFEDSILN